MISPNAPESAIRAEGLRKAFAGAGLGHGELELFRGLDLHIAPGEMIAIVGESGAGKSSLLHLLAALDKPTSGDVWFGPTRLGALSPKQASEFRNRAIGYVWQFHYLLPEFTAQENVAMPLLARGTRRSEALQKSSTGSPKSASPTAPSTAPENSPAASNSASRSLEPWSPSPRSSSPTNPPEI